MARRGGEAPTRRAPGGVCRTSGPTRGLVALNPGGGAVASALATAGALGALAAGLPPAASAAAAATVVGAFGARVGGRTAGAWISLRRNSGKVPEQAALFSRDGVGVVFDGRTASACVEVTPRPWQLTTITADGASESPTISADHLRRQLSQYGVRCSRLTAVCAGYKFAARDDAAGVLDALIGPVSAPLGGTTILVVSMALDVDTLGQSYQRARREPVSGDLSLPDGLCRTLAVAATRVCHSLSENGFGGRLMSAARVREFHDAVLAQVASSLADPRWETCGPTKGVHTRTYSPARGYWNSQASGAWHHLQSHRQYTTLTLTPQGDGAALAQPLITYLVGSDDPLSKASGYGLRPAAGQQAAGLSQALPVAASVPLRTPGALIDDTRRLGFGVPAGGAGMFVGSRSDKTRVFVAVTPSDAPLWLCGPKIFALQMVARLSTQDLRISVMVDDPAWRNLVDHRRTPTLTAGTLGTIPTDAVVCTPQWWELHRDKCAGKAVILVTEEDPGRLATNHIAVVTAGGGGASQVRVSVDAQSAVLGWELTPLERRALLGDVDPAGATPSLGAGIQLSELVQLPAPPPRRRTRRRHAEAPVVPTVDAITPEGVLEAAGASAARTPVRTPVRPARPRPRMPRPAASGEIQFVSQAEPPDVGTPSDPAPRVGRHTAAADTPGGPEPHHARPVEFPRSSPWAPELGVGALDPPGLPDPPTAARAEAPPRRRAAEFGVATHAGVGDTLPDTTARIACADAAPAPAALEFATPAEVVVVDAPRRPPGRSRRHEPAGGAGGR